MHNILQIWGEVSLMFGLGKWGFQNFLREGGAKTEFLFYYIMSQMFFVALGVLIIIGVNFLKGGLYRYEKSVSYHEFLWTVIPTLILCSVAVPSMAILYNHEQEIITSLSVKCVGHQWYWRYEYRELEEVEFDRLIVPTRDLERGEVRYLEVDNRLVIPRETGIRFLVTREDVIHSFALPVAGVKIDAIPGRLNVVNVRFPWVGLFLGQCRELCGANHSLMPICIEVTIPSLLEEWVSTF